MFWGKHKNSYDMGRAGEPTYHHWAAVSVADRPLVIQRPKKRGFNGDPDHRAKLMEGVAAWNSWRDQNRNFDYCVTCFSYWFGNDSCKRRQKVRRSSINRITASFARSKPDNAN